MKQFIPVFRIRIRNYLYTDPDPSSTSINLINHDSYCFATSQCHFIIWRRMLMYLQKKSKKNLQKLIFCWQLASRKPLPRREGSESGSVSKCTDPKHWFKHSFQNKEQGNLINVILDKIKGPIGRKIFLSDLKSAPTPASSLKMAWLAGVLRSSTRLSNRVSCNKNSHNQCLCAVSKRMNLPGPSDPKYTIPIGWRSITYSLDWTACQILRITGQSLFLLGKINRSLANAHT